MLRWYFSYRGSIYVMKNTEFQRRLKDPHRLKVYVIGYLLGLVVFYLVSSVIRMLAGTSASAAWVPSSAIWGVWAGFALWSLVAAAIIWFVNRRKFIHE
jgi:hypothetical protein